MSIKPFALICFLALLCIAGRLTAVSVTIELEFYENRGQTSLYRAEIADCGLSSINRITVLDSAKGGGSDGIYSGFDVDVVLLDRDGNLMTLHDQVLPIEDQSTFVSRGSVVNASTTLFVPTDNHPGVLFGLDANGSIDFAVATLAICDASYPADLSTGQGWVSIGVEGLLVAEVPPTPLDPQSPLWLIVGEVGIGSGEAMVAILESAQ